MRKLLVFISFSLFRRSRRNLMKCASDPSPLSSRSCALFHRSGSPKGRSKKRPSSGRSTWSLRWGFQKEPHLLLGTAGQTVNKTPGMSTGQSLWLQQLFLGTSQHYAGDDLHIWHALCFSNSLSLLWAVVDSVPDKSQIVSIFNKHVNALNKSMHSSFLENPLRDVRHVAESEDSHGWVRSFDVRGSFVCWWNSTADQLQPLAGTWHQPRQRQQLQLQK